MCTTAATQIVFFFCDYFEVRVLHVVPGTYSYLCTVDLLWVPILPAQIFLKTNTVPVPTVGIRISRQSISTLTYYFVQSVRVSNLVDFASNTAEYLSDTGNPYWNSVTGQISVVD